MGGSTANPAPGSPQKRVRKTADEISEEIAEAQRECRRILIQRLGDELPNAKARPAERATCYGILTDKDIKWQQMRAEAEARGAHTPLSDFDREQLEACAEAYALCERAGIERPTGPLRTGRRGTRTNTRR